MTDALYLVLASGLTFIAMSWLALSLPSHWKQVAEGKPHSKRLKTAGWLTLAASGNNSPTFQIFTLTDP